MTGEDFAVPAGWGHSGAGDAVMPGWGRAVERSCAPEESEAMGDASDLLGDRTFDVYLTGEAFWRNVPAAIWDYRLGGYQVLKKWLSYREQKVLGRRLRAEEAALRGHGAADRGASGCPIWRGGEEGSVGRGGGLLGLKLPPSVIKTLQIVMST